MRTLIIEDDFSNRVLLQQILGPFGEADTASDGTRALETIQGALESGRPYTLICLDLMMPNLDGYETLERIRRMEAENGVTGEETSKIVVVSAVDAPKNVEATFEGRCDAYFVKPIKKGTLLEGLRSLGLIPA